LGLTPLSADTQAAPSPDGGLLMIP
jgi:hypothetical protein